MEQHVIKKDGTKQAFDILKIRKKLQFAAKPTTVNLIELESKLNFSQKKTWKTSEINDYIIQTLAKDISIENQEYDIIVGRLAMDNLYRSIWKQHKINVEDFEEMIGYLVRNEYYRKDVLKYLENLKPEDKQMIKDYIRNNNYDFNLIYSQVMILKSKYLIKNRKGIIEYPVIADLVNSLILFEGGSETFEFFKLLNQQYISLATPFKANLRKPNGNTGSCFIGETDDNIHSITKSWKDISLISKNGGGVGWYISKLRPSGSYSKNVVEANLITKWIKIYNDIIVAVNQGGVRQGALTLALDWWHLDFMEFLDVKTEEGNLREKAFDIFPQVVVDNWFMEKVKYKEEVYLFNHYEFRQKTKIDITELIGSEYKEAMNLAQQMAARGEIEGKKLKANYIWKEILKVWIKIGDLYIVNRDNLNFSNYLKDYAITKCANLCVESYSLTKVAKNWKEEISNETVVTESSDGLYHSCSLISINMSKEDILDNLQNVVAYAIKALDKSIDKGTMPIIEAKKSARMLRNVGLGTVGIADLMARHKKMFNQEDGLQWIEAIFEKISYYAYRTSIELAKKHGAYELFNKANYDKILGRDPEELNKMSLNNFDWIQLQQDIKKHGIRNFLLLAIAPNTSTGVVMGATASYLPVFNKEMYQTFNDMNVPIIPKYIKNRYWFYKTKFQYHPAEIIKYTRRVQRWIDTGISMELNIDPTFVKINEISNAIIDGFLSGELKAVYYSLTKDREKAGSSCTDCAN